MFTPQFTSLYDTIKNQIWFIPSILIIAAGIIATGLLWLDFWYAAQINGLAPWLFTGTPDAARGLLSTIASSVITVISIAFSITIVALQQASTQYSPRVLRTFTKSKGSQIVLGMFIATFVFALITLRAIRSADQTSSDGYVPSIAVSFALLLTLVCMTLLVYFIHHISDTLQVSQIIRRIHKDLINQIEEMFPEKISQPAREPKTAQQLIDELQDNHDQHVVTSVHSGFVQKVDKKALAQQASIEVDWIYISCQVGQFVSKGDTIAVSSKKIHKNTDIKNVRKAIVISSNRSLEQDPLFGVRQLVDIALKALSPSINDPTTAEYCIYYIADAVKRLAQKKFPDNKRVFPNQNTVYIFDQPSWDTFIDHAFTQIRIGAQDNWHVLQTLKTELEGIKNQTPTQVRQKALDHQLTEVNKAIR